MFSREVLLTRSIQSTSCSHGKYDPRIHKKYPIHPREYPITGPFTLLVTNKRDSIHIFVKEVDNPHFRSTCPPDDWLFELRQQVSSWRRCRSHFGVEAFSAMRNHFLVLWHLALLTRAIHLLHLLGCYHMFYVRERTARRVRVRIC